MLCLLSIRLVMVGACTSHVRKMIKKNLSVDNEVVKGNVVYKVAYHHWPEQHILPFWAPFSRE